MNLREKIIKKEKKLPKSNQLTRKTHNLSHKTDINL
jgi:hypothetical protein